MPRNILTIVLALGAAIACDAMGGQDECATPKSDVEFIDAMVPHHRAAVEMADREIEHGESSEVLAMAQMIRKAQEAEILDMQAIREQLTGSGTVPEHHDAQMAAAMEKLMAVSGAALDRVFLEEMLPHHAAAVTMSHVALPYLERADLRAMADKILIDQAKEIGEIAMMLEP